MDLGLKGKKAIVTGATRGIGRRIADLLADEGCSVAICARAEDQVIAAVEALKGKGVNAFGKALNVRRADDYKAFLEEAVTALGGVDIFVSNVSAGGGMDSERNWNRNFEIDLMAAVRGCETLIPHLKKSEAGSIVLMGTLGAAEEFIGPMAYNALKTAIITYGKQLSQVLMKRGIRVNTVSPGPTVFEGSNWEMVQIATPKLYRSTLRQHPQRRMGSPEEIANCVVFLASPAASWVTGADFLVDGGFSKRVQF